METAAYFGDQQAKRETQQEDLGCQGHVTGFLPTKCRFFLFLFWLRSFFWENKTKEKRYHLEVEHGNPIRKGVPGADTKSETHSFTRVGVPQKYQAERCSISVECLITGPCSPRPAVPGTVSSYAPCLVNLEGLLLVSSIPLSYTFPASSSMGFHKLWEEVFDTFHLDSLCKCHFLTATLPTSRLRPRLSVHGLWSHVSEPYKKDRNFLIGRVGGF